MTGFLGIVCGLKSEASSLGALARDPRVRISVSGASAERAGAMAEALVRDGACGLLSYGVSGGLSPLVNPGDLLLATDIHAGATALPTDQSWADAMSATALAQGLPLHFGSILGSDVIVATAADKEHLGRKTGALAVDMESHALAMAAKRAGLPFGALRAVADPVTRAIPDSAKHGVAPDGSVRPLNVIGAALRRPADFVDLIRVGQDSAKATKALRRSAGHLVPLLFRIMNLD